MFEMYADELALSGAFVMSVFQGLSAGKTLHPPTVGTPPVPFGIVVVVVVVVDVLVVVEVVDDVVVDDVVVVERGGFLAVATPAPATADARPSTPMTPRIRILRMA